MNKKYNNPKNPKQMEVGKDEFLGWLGKKGSSLSPFIFCGSVFFCGCVFPLMSGKFFMHQSEDRRSMRCGYFGEEAPILIYHTWRMIQFLHWSHVDVLWALWVVDLRWTHVLLRRVSWEICLTTSYPTTHPADFENGFVVWYGFITRN